MSPTPDDAQRPSRRQWPWWFAAALALAFAVVFLMGTLPRGEPAVVVLSRASSASAPAAVEVARSRPVELVIPAIGVRTSVGLLGLQADDEVMVPTSTHTVGWYDQGVTPGMLGSAVILGHVDSYLGPGTLFDLKNLKAGDTIATTLADGTVTHFVVVAVVQYSKTAFPDRLVYGSHGTRSLQLVTCGGIFDHRTGHYEANIVVFSRLVSVTTPRTAVSS